MTTAGGEPGRRPLRITGGRTQPARADLELEALVVDMVADGLVHLQRPEPPVWPPDLALLERVLEGLRSI